MLLYTFIGYGFFIFLFSRVFAKEIDKKSFFPVVSIVTAVYNEENVIAQRIKNILSLDYPKDKLELVIVSDGSIDRTAEIAGEFNIKNIKLIKRKARSGKPSCLNDGVSQCKGDIVVFTDARQRFEPDAIKQLAAYFNDTTVGVVSGELHFEDEMRTVTGEGIDFYWKYEKFLRKAESRFDSTTGATGAIYAIRKNLFKPIPPDILLDDVLIPMNIVMDGYRCVFEPKAIAYDRVVQKGREEARRKTRTIAGNFQLFSRFPRMLDPFKNRIWFQTFSHKFLRLLSPIFIVLFLISNIFIAGRTLFDIFLLLQGLFYLFVIMGYILRRANLRCKIFSIPYAFILLNLVTIKAFFEYLYFNPQNIWRTRDT